MQATIEVSERSGEVFSLDILSHRMSVMGIYRQLSKTGNSKGKGRVNQNPKYAYPSNALQTEPNDVGGSVRDCADSPPGSIEVGCQSDWSSNKERCKTGGHNCLHGRVGLRVRIEVGQDESSAPQEYEPSESNPAKCQPR